MARGSGNNTVANGLLFGSRQTIANQTSLEWNEVSSARWLKLSKIGDKDYVSRYLRPRFGSKPGINLNYTQAIYAGPEASRGETCKLPHEEAQSFAANLSTVLAFEFDEIVKGKRVPYSSRFLAVVTKDVHNLKAGDLVCGDHRHTRAENVSIALTAQNRESQFATFGSMIRVAVNQGKIPTNFTPLDPPELTFKAALEDLLLLAK